MHRVKSSFCLIQEELNNLTKHPYTLTQNQPPDKPRHPQPPSSDATNCPQLLTSAGRKRLTLAIAFRGRKMQAICFHPFHTLDTVTGEVVVLAVHNLELEVN